MNSTNVTSKILDNLSDSWPELTPETRKAARYVLDNPQDVSVLTVRKIAAAANVQPNTVVRMARQMGFDGYDEFRQPFREEIRNSGSSSYQDRAKWLQDVSKSGKLGALYADMVSGALNNIQDTFASIDEAELKAAAEDIWKSRNVYTLGVGINNANARNFTYLASTGMIQFHTIPTAGNTPVDDIAFADKRDVLIAITCSPYRREVIETVEVAKDQGLKVIAISDSKASPIIRAADHGFVVSVDTPQFFPSSVSIIALLETLLSFVIAVASDKIVTRVRKFHERRHELGIYENDEP